MDERGLDRAESQAHVESRTYGTVAPKISDQVRIEQLTAERDRYASMLLSAEQELAKRSLAESDDLEWYRQAFLLLIDSRSWRLTRPLRDVGSFARRCMPGRTKP